MQNVYQNHNGDKIIVIKTKQLWSVANDKKMCKCVIQNEMIIPRWWVLGFVSKMEGGKRKCGKIKQLVNQSQNVKKNQMK